MDKKEQTKTQKVTKVEVQESKSISEKKVELIPVVKKKVRNKSLFLIFITDLVLLAIAIFFIVNLPKKAAELNQVKSEEQKVKESKKIDITGLEYQPTKESVDKLTGFYPMEDGVIDFIEMVEVLKDSGRIKNFALVGQDAVKDKTGAFGIPFIIEIEDSWENINISLQEFQKLPYLIRAINVEVRVIDENTISFKYGGFLYVSDKLAKTR